MGGAAAAAPPPPEWATLAAGTMAGLINALAVGPLDTVKSRIQIQRRLGDPTKLRYTGTFSSLVRIYREEGVRGLYRGFQPTIVGYIPTWSLYFSLYNALRADLRTSYPDLSPHLNTMGAAVGAGAVSNIATNPIWVIRTRLQTQEHVLHKPEYASMWDAARKMYTREGFRSFYKGLAPNMLGLVHVAIQFPLYEELKHARVVGHRARSHPDHRGVDVEEDDDEAEPGAVQLLLASSVSKLVASSATYPLEVVRTRLHVQKSDGPQLYGSVFGALARIAKDEGVAGVYAGIGTNLLRVVPACAVTFVTFELVLGYLAPKPRKVRKHHSRAPPLPPRLALGGSSSSSSLSSAAANDVPVPDPMPADVPVSAPASSSSAGSRAKR